MKTIGWCLDQIQMVMAKIPRDLMSRDNAEHAKTVLAEVQKYANTLAQIIMHSGFKDVLSRLEHSSIEEVRLEAHQIEELFKDLEHMLYVLNLYITNLSDLVLDRLASDDETKIQDISKQWSLKADQVVLMIDQKFGGEMGELRKEFQAVLHTEEELKNIITLEEHLAHFLKNCVS